ncbi:helix-turn-helix transcriptional regulator [Polymorphospora sp. NPDC051019]|uniref:helix-turn-helix domain-containing protein n=1 Tax=Polymorphospora sp. NPDC051019 TaxID=3155725 RepID=UPI00341611B0
MSDDRAVAAAPAGRLNLRLGQLLRLERERARLSQRALAARAGTSQQCVSRFETGFHAPTTAVVERLFEALGCQVRADVEALDADLDESIAVARRERDDDIRFMLGNLGSLLRWSGGLDYVIDGELAAALQGVPVRVTRADVAVAAADLPRLTDWIFTLPNCERWNERWRDFVGADRDPNRPGPLRWWTPLAELRVRLLETWPTPVPVVAGAEEVPVRPLLDVLRDDPQLDRVARRARVLGA